jgi:putative inorganic carbon (HCO3(-)) transporter
MSLSPRPVEPPEIEAAPARPNRWWDRLAAAAAVGVVGFVLGIQYVQPNKRVLSVMVAAVVAGIAWRLDMLTGIGLLVFALPYPRGTVFGNTNLAFILLLLVIWLLRVTQRLSLRPTGTPVDVPVIGLVVLYIVSFYNVTEPTSLRPAIENFQLFLGCVLMFYLIVNNVRSSADLRRLHYFQLLSALSVFLLGIYELNNPGGALVRGWIDFGGTEGSEFNTRNVRIGASFSDFELLSEFCAITLLTVLLQLVRATTQNGRWMWTAMLVLNLFVMFATVTRGAFIALGAGAAVLLWHVRKRVRVVPAVTIGSAVVAAFVGMNFYVANFTRSGDVFKRLAETQLTSSYLPDNRADVWANAVDRAMVHPLIGHGPYYADIPGFSYMWPHNVYLYVANLIGFVGLGFFLWLLVRMLWLVRPVTDDFRHPDYAKAALVVAQAQLVIFMVNEIKIDYLRNGIYQFVVWVMFASMVAAGMIARRGAAGRKPW